MFSEREKTKMIVRAIFVIVGAWLLWEFLRALPVVCIGNAVGTVFSVMMIGAGFFLDKLSAAAAGLWKTGGGKAALVTLGIIVLSVIVYCVTMSVLMVKAISGGEERKADAVIVLGCQIKGDRPSRMLRIRLDKACEYLKDDPDCICIVSGGKGDDENYPEAEIMKKYLVEQGIDASRITMEDKSTSTKENMRFSKAILDDMGISGNICFVSDGYHLFRAGLIAKDEGLDAFGLAAKTEARFVPTYWVREWLSIGYYFIGQ